jgi:hypothetical protein
MSAYETLRAAVASTGNALRDIQRFPTVEVNRIDLAELLAEFDALTNVGTAPASKYTPEFEAAWSAYPARPGASKAATFKAWKARLKSGATAQQMIEGAAAYAAYCKAERTEPQFIKQAATFFGPGEFYAADWAPRRPPATGALALRGPGGGPRPSLDEINAQNNREAERLLFGGMDEGRTFNAT